MKRKPITFIGICALALSICSSSVFAQADLIEGDKVVVKVTRLQVRQSAPNAKGNPGPAIDRVSKGTQLTILRRSEREASWFEVSYLGGKGWIQAEPKFVTFIPPYAPGDQLKVITDQLDVYKEATSKKGMGFVAQGEILTVIQESGQNPPRVKVQTPETGTIGWVDASRKFVTRLDAQSNGSSGEDENAQELLQKLKDSPLESENQKLKLDKADLEKEKNQLVDQMKALEKEKEALGREKANLAEKNKQLEQEVKRLKSLEAELDPLKSRLDRATKEVTTFRQVIAAEIQTLLKSNQTSPSVRELQLPFSDQQMPLVYIPAGQFSMGLSAEEVKAFIRETQNPVYEIEEVPSDRRTQSIPNGFLIGKYEVTHEEYQALIPEHPYSPTMARQPVTNLTAEQIQAFLKVLNEAYPQLDIGLPTEKEWEYVAKGAGGNQLYTWGDLFDKKKANVDAKKMIAVGQKPESDSWCGVSDLIGNAAEVCEIDTETYPQKGEQRLVARGGSYKSNPHDSRITTRHPLWTPKSEDIGFRIVVRLKKK